MRGNIPAMIARVANTFARRAGTWFAARLGSLAAERARRIAQDREFYRSFHAYCRANNLNSVCADDWKTMTHCGNRDNGSPSKETCHGHR
jgi:hypothetical protein